MEWEFEERSQTAIVNRPRGPFQVPMSILIPADTEGLIAAEKNLSMSRLAGGALRLQPITMMTGQAAGALAAVCVKNGIQPRKVHPIRVQWELLKSDVSLSLCHYSDVPPEHPLNKSVQISNLYGFIDANEYPHAPSYNIREFDDPVLAMAIIRGQDKGRFGVDDIITVEYAETILERVQKAMNISAKKVDIDEQAHHYISRGEFAKAVCDTLTALKGATPPKNAKAPFIANKHRYSEYVETLGRLGILDVYGDGQNFSYGKPVTKGEAADIIVRACVEAAGL